MHFASLIKLRVEIAQIISFPEHIAIQTPFPDLLIETTADYNLRSIEDFETGKAAYEGPRLPAYLALKGRTKNLYAGCIERDLPAPHLSEIGLLLTTDPLEQMILLEDLLSTYLRMGNVSKASHIHQRLLEMNPDFNFEDFSLVKYYWESRQEEEPETAKSILDLIKSISK